MTGDGQRDDVEGARLRQRSAVEPLEECGGVRALDLVAVDITPARRVLGEDLIPLQLDIPRADLRLVLEPVVPCRPADEGDLLGVGPVEDPVADHVTTRTAADIVARLVLLEGGEAVDSRCCEECERVLAADRGRCHVVRLIVEGYCLAPCALLIAPIRELRGDELRGLTQHGISHDRALGIGVKDIDDAGVGVDHVLERRGVDGGGHGSLLVGYSGR